MTPIGHATMSTMYVVTWSSVLRCPFVRLALALKSTSVNNDQNFVHLQEDPHLATNIFTKFRYVLRFRLVDRTNSNRPVLPSSFKTSNKPNPNRNANRTI